MLCIGIRYLNGWVMATHPTDRMRPEWPPHPDRLFMALAAAHFETLGGDDERAALEWLEAQPAPELICSAKHAVRDTVTAYVPVNDSSDPIKKGKPLMSGGSMPIGRDRQARQFPVAIPDDPTVYFVWNESDPTPPMRAALETLAAKVTYVGHSASLVQAWLDEAPPSGSSMDVARVRLTPSERRLAASRLRVPSRGRLAGLEQRYNRAAIEEYAIMQAEIARSTGKRKKELQNSLTLRFGDSEPQSLRPTLGTWAGYVVAQPAAPAKPTPRRSHFSSNLIILKQVDGRRFTLPSTLMLTEALRNVVMIRSRQQPPPEWLSGHAVAGEPSKRERGHVALFPLSHVGYRGNGSILGFALALPDDVPDSELECLEPLLWDNDLPRQNTLTLGRAGCATFEWCGQVESRVNLTPEVWTADYREGESGCRRWATVTPIAVDRHVRGESAWVEMERVIKDNCERIGLPRPAEVVTSHVSPLVGAPVAHDMPRIIRKRDGGAIRHCHAVLLFDEPVIGPILLGAGRYRGYGLCRPLHDRSEARS